MAERGEEDDAAIRTFKIEGCCHKKCCDKFTLDELLQYNFESRNLDYYYEGTNMLDLVLLGEIRAMSRTTEGVKRGNSTVSAERQRMRMIYAMKGITVCESVFNCTCNQNKKIQKAPETLQKPWDVTTHPR